MVNNQNWHVFSAQKISKCFYIQASAFKHERSINKLLLWKVGKRNLLLVSVICVKAKSGGGTAITVSSEQSI